MSISQKLSQKHTTASKYKAGVDVARHAPMEVEIARLCSDYFVRGWAGGDLGIGPTLYNSSINYDSVKWNLTDLEQYLECEEDYMTLPVSDNDTYTFASVIEDTGSGLKYVRNRADKALRANDFAQLGFWFMNDTTVDNVGAVMVDFTEIQEETAPYQFNFKAVYGPDIPALAQKVNMTDTAEFDTLQIFKSQKMLESSQMFRGIEKGDVSRPTRINRPMLPDGSSFSLVTPRAAADFGAPSIEPPAPAGLEARLGGIANTVTNLFPVWVVIAGTVALTYPPAFTWFQMNKITWGLALTMLGMGFTMKIADFTAVFTKQPQLLLLGMGLQFTLMPLIGYTISR
eukprot:gene10344-8280_t